MENLKMSNQAVGTMMMILQRSLMNAAMNRPASECDAGLMMEKLNLYVRDGQVFVENPPAVETTIPGTELGEA